MTHFQLVGEFHDTFDHPQKDTLYVDCFTKEPELVPFRISLMKEELGEFKDAYKNNDFVEMADALCDLSYVANGAGQVLGINVDNLLKKMDIDISTPENISKVDTKSDQSIIIEHGMELITDALNEFCKSAASKNLDRMATCLANIIKNVYDLGHKLNLNMDNIFREVHRSNMTKVCTNVEDAQASIEFYKSDERYKDPSVKKKGKYFVIFDGATTKILKNHKWESPKISNYM